MKNNFAAGLSKLKDVSGKVEPQPVAPPAPEQPVPVRRSTSEPAPSRKGKVAISAYFDEAVRQQLAILAVKEKRSQAALMAEALNLLFERYGEPTIARA
jgi:predicted nucleic acid-binding Zn ribbon protein